MGQRRKIYPFAASFSYFLIFTSVFLWRPTHHTKTRSRLKSDELTDKNSSLCTEHFKHLHNPPVACQVVHLIPFKDHPQTFSNFPGPNRRRRRSTEINHANASGRAWQKLSHQEDQNDQNEGILIYQFRLFDTPIQVRLLKAEPDEILRPRQGNDRDDLILPIKRAPTPVEPVTTQYQDLSQDEDKNSNKILVQYFSRNFTSPVHEEEITVRQDVKCIYDGYFDPEDLSILLFDTNDDASAPLKQTAAAPSLNAQNFTIGSNGSSDHIAEKIEYKRANDKGHKTQHIHKNAIFNLCGSGMMGMFQMDGEQYFIEPLKTGTNKAVLKDVKNDATSKNSTNTAPNGPPSKRARILEGAQIDRFESNNNVEDHLFQPHIVYSLSSLKGFPLKDFARSLNDQTLEREINGDRGDFKTVIHDDFSSYPKLESLSSPLDHSYDNPDHSSEYDDGTAFPSIRNVAENSSKIENTQKLGRGKRSVSREHFIEIMMVADYEVAKAHGTDLQRYILTIMSIVQMIYKNPSIGNAINIALVKIAIFQDSEYSPKITENGKTTLDNFCKWQYEHNTKSQHERYHHDTAVLLTRQDICSNEINCQALAITNGWICDPLSSCSIAEDNGLSVALTIAHELGHNLGLPHDGDALCKEFKSQDEDLEKYHIMSEVLNPTTRSLSWSDCSHHYLTAFLDKGHGQCLLNQPENMEYMAQMKALRHPGEEYSVHQQCQLIFGPYSHYCPNKLPPCQLYCLNKDHRCQADFIPWADGTPCGHHRWCQSGKCIDKTYHTVPVDGGWSQWSEYTPCSRSCGGGAMTATRTCTDPTPSNNGKYCLGRRSRVKSCNTQECLLKSDFRDEQCAKMNGNNMGIVGIPPGVKWRAAYDIPSSDKCKLYCYASDSTAYKLSNKVIDGTPCDPESTHICIQGICRPVGCDQILGSKAQFDRCGVCGGDNSTCRTVSGSYNEIHYGYNNVGRVPRGAMNIDIRQYGMHGIEADDNYLALMDSKGNYLINGDNSITMTRLDTKFGGIFLQYTGSNTAVERINATGMIKEDLIIQVLTVGHLYPPDIRYSYEISSTFKPAPNVYIWNTYGPWSRCSCKGVRSRKILCMNSRTYDIELNSKCSHLDKPSPIEEKCRSECDFRWHVIDRTPCSVSCGQGFQKNVVVCMRLNDVVFEDKTYMQAAAATTTATTSVNLSSIVANSECQNDPRKPPFIQPCYLKPCPLITHWDYTPWSSCSVSCGGGIRTRKATCKDGHNRTVGPHLCNSTLTVLSQICQTSPCPVWTTSSWDLCSTPCGNGIRTRQVWCQQENQQIDYRFCPSHMRPRDRELCQISAQCVWNFNQWGPCSSSCGHGYKTRSVHCVVREVANNTTFDPSISQQSSNALNPYDVIDESKCDPSVKPINIESCETNCQLLPNINDNNNYNNYNNNDNIPKALTSVASSHDVQRLETYRATELTLLPPGYKNRINFQRNDQMSVTGAYSIPYLNEYQRSSNSFIPKIYWRAGTWTSCSKPCGDGTQERHVVCHYENGTEVTDQKACELYVAKPVTSQLCKVKFCGSWRVGSWQKCLTSCGSGTKHRYVACVLYNNGQITDEFNCDPAQKPASRTECILRPCPKPAISHPNNEEFHKPIRHKSIISNHVYTAKWYDGQGKSSHLVSLVPTMTAGRHSLPVANDRLVGSFNTTNDVDTNSIYQNQLLKHKKVVMVNPVQPVHNPYAALGQAKSHYNLNSLAYSAPNPAQDLVRSPIKNGIWRVGPWSRCSKICGSGWKRRLVICQTNYGQNSDHCDISRKPTNIHECIDKPCYFWQLDSKWTPCNATCGAFGFKGRAQLCIRESDRTVAPETNCDVASKPAKEVSQCRGSCFGENGNRKRPNRGPKNAPKLRASAPTTTYIRHKKNGVDVSSPAGSEMLSGKNGTVPYLSIGPWGPCSVTCGIGFQKRQIKCHFGSEEFPPRKCRHILATKKLASIRYCQKQRSCHYYEWKSYNWTSDQCEKNCDATAITGTLKRRVECVDFKKQVMPDLLCQHRKKPLTERPCNESYAILKTFDCLSSPNYHNKNKGVVVSTNVSGLLIKPPSTSTPIIKYSWHKSAWTRCTSNMCSIGLKFRRVWCSPAITNVTEPITGRSYKMLLAQNSSLCTKRKPKSIKTCRINHMCKVKSCYELKTRANLSTDGTYDIMVHEKRKKIYCHEMNTSTPKEYLSLPSGDSINYFEFYDKRLIIPNACPKFDRKLANCRCVKSENNMSGLTFFSKVRVDLTALRIIGNDYTFSLNVKGKFISYATAGDCFSLVNCPQGKFNIDLSGTGFMLSNLTSQWDTYGHRPSMNITINKSFTQVNGTCGGYCGRCTVHDGRGLVIIPI